MANHTKAKKIFQYNYLLKLLVSKNIKNQYYRSVLGILWTLLNPLLHMLVMAFVFSEIFGRGERGGLDYPVYLMSGTILFGLLRQGTSGALTCLVSQHEMLQKTKIPMWIFPTSNVLSALVSFGFSFISLIIVMLIRIPKGVTFHPQMLMIILMLPALLLFTMGLSFIVSSIYVFFRDMKHIYEVLLLLWQYLTPLFYPIDIIKNEKALFVMKLNPMFHYIDYFRNTLLNITPSFVEHLICYGWGIVMFLIGFLVLKVTKNKIVAKL